MADGNRNRINGRLWCFTINNPVAGDDPNGWDKAKVKFCFWQKEQGAEGTPHYQGVVSLFRVSRITALKKINGRAHWTCCNGTLDQNIAYCSKSETKVDGPWEYGDRAHQGKRSDLLLLKDAVEEGKSELEIAESEELHVVWAKYYKAMERYKRLRSSKARTWPTHTTVLWGPPGTGKTKWCLDNGGDAYWLKKPGQGQTLFFDGYDGQETVVIDEFYGWIPFDLMCRMCDRYPLMVDTKGGMVNFYPKRIFITSNMDPTTWYKKGLGALERRFKQPLGQILYCGHGWVPAPLEVSSLEASVSAQMEVDAAAASSSAPSAPIINMFGSHAAECTCVACGPPRHKGHSVDCRCTQCDFLRCYEDPGALAQEPLSPLSSPQEKRRRCECDLGCSSTCDCYCH